MKRIWTWIALGAAFAHTLVIAPGALAAADGLHKTVGGYSIYVGVVSAGIMAFRQDHGELRMHGGVPAGLDQHHVLVTLFDAASGARVADAEVTARVSAPKRQTEEKRLLHVPLGSEIAYGNFFRMRQGERYRIELTIRRAGSAEAVTAGFDYRHRL
jgi:hypothetical protein